MDSSTRVDFAFGGFNFEETILRSKRDRRNMQPAAHLFVGCAALRLFNHTQVATHESTFTYFYVDQSGIPGTDPEYDLKI